MVFGLGQVVTVRCVVDGRTLTNADDLLFMLTRVSLEARSVWDWWDMFSARVAYFGLVESTWRWSILCPVFST